MSQPTTLNHTLVPMPTRQHADRAEALWTLSIALIDSAVDILEHHVRTDEQLSKDSALLPGGTLGKHFRHVCSLLFFFVPCLDPTDVFAPWAGHRDFPSILITSLSCTYYSATHPRDQLRCYPPIFSPSHRSVTRFMSISYASN